MTDEQQASAATETAPDSAAEREITFRDRPIWVHLPTPEQLLVWKRVLRQLQTPGDLDASQVMQALERARKIIDSVLVNRLDIDWLDDLMLDGDLTLNDAAGILQSTLDAFALQGESNRADRRAAKSAKPKKVTRRKATTR